MEEHKGVHFETDKLTGDKIIEDHDYDGIKELDNNLPKWWLWLSSKWALAGESHLHE